jgi:hypothetical protein
LPVTVESLERYSLLGRLAGPAQVPPAVSEAPHSSAVQSYPLNTGA